MDGEFTGRETVAEAIAGLIRCAHSGLCSGEPKGIWYPGVPSVENIMEEIDLTDENALITEDQWIDACEAIGEGE